MINNQSKMIKSKMIIFLTLLLIFLGGGESRGDKGKGNPNGKKLHHQDKIWSGAQSESNKSKGKKLAGPGLVEAEKCRKTGTWKAWDLPVFSGGRCLNNEDPDHTGKAASSSALYLDFQGTGVAIIYRQDTWYGSLIVEIDNKKVGTINQRGVTKNQVEAPFKAGDRVPHSLVLRGAKATGVITVDALRVLGD